MARDVTKRAHLRPGLKVKIVPEGTKPGEAKIAEGIVAQVLSGDDDAGVVVALQDGTIGHVLRIWEGGEARKDAPPAEEKRPDTLPSYNVEPKAPPAHKKFIMDDKELEKRAAEAMGKKPGGLGRLIVKNEEGLDAGALKRFAIDDDELAELTKASLGKVRETDMGRLLARGPEDELADREKTPLDDKDLRKRDDDDDDERGPPRGGPPRGGAGPRGGPGPRGHGSGGGPPRGPGRGGRR